MHDQQYLLVGSGNALHSIDLTLPSDKQVIRTHILGVAFKEIHCLEDIGLVVVIAGRNARVRCYDYDAIKRLISYGHSREGQGRVVQGGKLGAMKNMIQLRVETAFMKEEASSSSNPPRGESPTTISPKAVVGGMAGVTQRILKGSSSSIAPAPSVSVLTSTSTTLYQPHPPPLNRHQHASSVDQSLLLSPPLRLDSPGSLTSMQSDTGSTGVTQGDVNDHDVPAAAATPIKKSKQRPLSFGGLASLAHEHVMKKTTPQQQQQQQPSSTPASPSTGSGYGTAAKNNRLSQVASYLSQAAANSNMATHISNGQDAPSEQAVSWAWDFTKLKQTKDVLSLDFHYTFCTVYMTILSKNGIDIYCRPRSARGRRAAMWTAISSSSSTSPAATVPAVSNGDAPGRPSTSSMATAASITNLAASRHSTSKDNEVMDSNHGDSNPYEWRQYKQFYHPEAPSFMTVVKSAQEVTDIVLGKGTRACIVNVDTMSVTDLRRPETHTGIIQGISKKLGFRSSNNALWHSFEKIPFDVPPHILYPEAAAALCYGSHPWIDSKMPYATYGSEPSVGTAQRDASSLSSAVAVLPSETVRRSRDDIIQRPGDQQTMHLQQLEEQERAEAETMALKTQPMSVQAPVPDAVSSANSYSSTLSSSSTSYPSIQSVSNNNNNNNNDGIPSSVHSSIAATIMATANAVHNSHSGTSNPKTSQKTRMVTSDEVLNLAFNQRTLSQLFLATFGTQSRIVDLQGKPQSPVVLDWNSAPPQKVEFLRSDQDIYVVGFEKSSIVIFSLTRGQKVKEIVKKDLVEAADATAEAAHAARARAMASAAAASATISLPGDGRSGTTVATGATASLSPSLSAANTNNGSSTNHVSASIKFLGRDNIADDSLGIFFSYGHPRNGISICKLGIVSLARDDLELIGYY
ncbi:hypothetical protein EDD11_000635 [Mortierella claussenii]|nr:hypothetical protein EDD11_000635 [Mortierella claussenii]